MSVQEQVASAKLNFSSGWGERHFGSWESFLRSSIGVFVLRLCCKDHLIVGSAREIQGFRMRLANQTHWVQNRLIDMKTAGPARVSL